MKVWTWVAGTLALAAVGGVAGFGVAAHEQLSRIEHAPAFRLEQAAFPLVPAEPSLIDDTVLTDHPTAGELADYLEEHE